MEDLAEAKQQIKAALKLYKEWSPVVASAGKGLARAAKACTDSLTHDTQHFYTARAGAYSAAAYKAHEVYCVLWLARRSYELACRAAHKEPSKEAYSRLGVAIATCVFLCENNPIDNKIINATIEE